MLSLALYQNGPIESETDRYYFVSWHSLNNILDDNIDVPHNDDSTLVRVITVYKYDSLRQKFSLYCMNHADHQFEEYLKSKKKQTSPLHLNNLSLGKSVLATNLLKELE
jgi:hypothetical protein